MVSSRDRQLSEGQNMPGELLDIHDLMRDTGLSPKAILFAILLIHLHIYNCIYICMLVATAKNPLVYSQYNSIVERCMVCI